MADESSHIPEQLVEQLARGYDALNTEFRLLNDYRKELENKLSWATRQYLDVLQRLTPNLAGNEYKSFLEELEEAGAVQQNGEVDLLVFLSKHADPDRRTSAYNIRAADDAREKLRIRKDMERDFTTPGTPGKLGCPFARPSAPPSTNGFRRNIATPRSSSSRHSAHPGRRSKRPSFADPIRAEICGQDPSCPAVSIENSVAEGSAPASAPLCPIRFLDQHSPEEVAQYFENHKHEIPRSHEICVRRYQSNEQSIRQLDAKYGNLVSMIQGLGMKHQPILLEKELDENGEDVDEPATSNNVQNWAKAVSASLHNETGADSELLPDEDREPHFDRPLKDVRVGESPSRPWGISIPAKYERARSTSGKSEPTASPRVLQENPMNATSEPPRKCPFDHTKFAQMQGEMPRSQPPPADPESPPQHSVPAPEADATPPRRPTFIRNIPTEPDRSGQATVVFNGPVFIGYSPEQAMTFLQQSGQGAKPA